MADVEYVSFACVVLVASLVATAIVFPVAFMIALVDRPKESLPYPYA